MRTTTGISTEAVYIFHNMVRKLRADYHPEYIAAIFESGKTFREEAERKGFRHFLEVFDPNAPEGLGGAEEPGRFALSTRVAP